MTSASKSSNMATPVRMNQTQKDQSLSSMKVSAEKTTPKVTTTQNTTAVTTTAQNSAAATAKTSAIQVKQSAIFDQTKPNVTT